KSGSNAQPADAGFVIRDVVKTGAPCCAGILAAVGRGGFRVWHGSDEVRNLDACRVLNVLGDERVHRHETSCELRAMPWWQEIIGYGAKAFVHCAGREEERMQFAYRGRGGMGGMRGMGQAWNGGGVST